MSSALLAFFIWFASGIAATAVVLVLAKFCAETWHNFRNPPKGGGKGIGRYLAAVPWDGLEAVLLAMVAIGAVLAFQTYRANNGHAMLIALEERDRLLGANYMADRNLSDFPKAKPGEEAVKQPKSLMLVFSDQPDLSAEAYRECNFKTRGEIKLWADKYMTFAGDINEPWNSIEELHDLMWSTKGMMNENYNRARAMVFHAINYLYIIHDAFHAENKNYFNEEERGMWSAYLDDLGTSPFFLLALRDGEKFSYTMRGISNQIREYMRARPDVRCVATTLYPSYFEAKPVVE